MGALDEYLKGKEKPAPLERQAITSASEQVGIPAYERGIPSKDTETDYARLFKEKGYAGAFRSLYRKPDFEAEEKQTRRERSLALLGDIAKVGLQGFAATRGARMFDPLRSQVPAYNERLRQLRDAQRGYEMEYAGKLFSAAAKDYELAKAGELARQKMAQEAETAAQKIAFDTWKAGIQREAEEKKMAELRRHNAAMESLSRQRIAKEAAKADKPVESVRGSDGNLYVRDSKLSDIELRQLVETYVDDDKRRPFEYQQRDVWGNVSTRTDWKSAAAYAIANGLISPEEFVARGFKKGKELSKEELERRGFVKDYTNEKPSPLPPESIENRWWIYPTEWNKGAAAKAKWEQYSEGNGGDASDVSEYEAYRRK